MEKIEQQIAKVNSDIDTVTKQIDSIEALLRKRFEDWNEEINVFGDNEVEARKAAREKEKQLREKKKQLNDILLEKEKQRTQGMVTFKELLNYSIPNLNSFEYTTNNKTGTVPTYPRDCGRSFEDWASFTQEVNDFCTSPIIT